MKEENKKLTPEIFLGLAIPGVLAGLFLFFVMKTAGTKNS
jgi:hypothetical protein